MCSDSVQPFLIECQVQFFEDFDLQNTLKKRDLKGIVFEPKPDGPEGSHRRRTFSRT